MTTRNFSKIFDFIQLVGRLKHIKRTGWVLRNVAEPECVSGHMHRMAVMSLLIDNSDNLDRLRCMQLALVHDLAECIIGDITPHCGICPKEKHRLEDDAMQKLVELAGPSGALLNELYKEYEAKETPEAKFVKELDNLDMIMEAFDYECKESTPGRLQEFFTSTSNKFSHPLVCGVVSELNQRRNSLNTRMPDGVSLTPGN